VFFKNLRQSKTLLLSILPLPLPPAGELAQLVERLDGMQEVSDHQILC